MPRILRHKPAAPRGGSGGRPPTAAPTASSAPPTAAAPAPGGGGWRGLPPAVAPPAWSAPTAAAPPPGGGSGSRPPAVEPPAWSAPMEAAPAPGEGSGSRALTVAPQAGASPSSAPPAAPAAGLCHHDAAAAPAPAPMARTPLNAKTYAKFAISAFVTSVSIILVHLPFMHFLVYGNLEATADIWNTEGLQVGLMNALMWLLYAASVYKRDGGPDIILSCAWSASAMLCGLMMLCAHARKLRSASLWYAITMITVIVALIILQLEPVGHLLSCLELIFGCLGIGCLVLTHVAQIVDLTQATKQMQITSAMLTILPTGFIAFQQIIAVYAKGSHQSIFMVVTCWINMMLYAIEIPLTILMTQHMLHERYKALKDKVISLRRFSSVKGDAKSTEEDKFSDFGEALQLLFGNNKENNVLVNLGVGSFGMEISRVLGGDIVPGSLILVHGDSGVGKSTLMLQIASAILEGLKVEESPPVVYVSSEETVQQIGNRARRMNIKSNQLYLYSSTNLEDALDKSLPVSPTALIVDSIQTCSVKSLHENSGSLPQVKECAHMLFLFAKATNIPVFLIGNIMETGDIAVHLFLEQIVDVLLDMEGKRCSPHRLLRPVKNRFGPINELGVFEMTGSGLKVVLDPSKLFLVDHKSDSERPAGCAVAVILHGSRTFAVTVQAGCDFGSHIRQVVGIPENRAYEIISILIKQGLYKLQEDALFLNVLGGFKLTEPAADLAIAVSLCSSFFGFAIPNNAAFIGEIGHGGELRTVPGIEKRVMDIAKLGYKMCVVPEASEMLLKQVSVDMDIVPCSNLKQVVNTIKPQS